LELSRRDLVLKLIVEEFVSTAEPVGSNTLIEKYQLPYSSATIRNEMAMLEQDGLIEKTHTSSGRVPSAKGYRYYVSHLDRDQAVDIDQEFKKEFQVVLKKKSRSIEEVVERSCEILSEMTNLATVVLGPKSYDEHLVSIQVIPISSQTATAVIVTDKGYVENKTFVTNDMSPETLSSCVKILNERLNGTSISEIYEKTEALKPLVTKMVGKNSELVMEAFTEAFVSFAKKRLHTYGATKLLELPDYDENREKVKNILHLLDSPEEFHEAIDGADNAVSDQLNGSISVKFVNDEEDDDMAIVSHKINIAGRGDTKIAVVGPKRMNYRQVLSNLEYVSKVLAEYFGGKEEDDEEEWTNRFRRKES